MSPSPELVRLIDHLDFAVSPHHSVEYSARRLVADGYRSVDFGELDRLPDRGFVADRGLLIAWRRGQAEGGFRIVGAHTDSPGLRIKPSSTSTAHGWRQLNVEVYGGILNNSWLDRDLGVAGVVVLNDGTTKLVRSSRPIARIPQLAIHLDRDVNERGLVLDRQQHLAPVWGLDDGSATSVIEWLARDAGIDPDRVRTWDLGLFDVSGAALLGSDEELLASGRIDNQVSCWAAVEGLIAASSGPSTAVVAMFDHEEVGSESTTGAAGPRLEWILEALHDGGRAELHARYSDSLCISADCAHSVHPNYPDRHDPSHRPLPNKGPVVKINANQRYATDSGSAAAFVALCERAGVPHQFFVSRNNMPCGSTIGPITATRLGIPTVDVGAAQLSMHSARELCGSADPVLLSLALREHFSS
ncbi:MAG: M18 family aminopeptidase [Actinomycetota bacterium]